MTVPWGTAGAIAKLRDDVNILAWLHAEQRVLRDTMWILNSGISADNALKILHADIAPCPSSDEHKPAEAGPLDPGP